MSEPLSLALAGLVGLLLGAVFFGGLWWTVRKGVSSKRPALWFLGSLIVRTGITLAGLYFVSGGQGRRLLASLLGFVIARFLVTRLFGRPAEQDSSRTMEVGHAPQPR